jgi:hypothetical protein
LGHLNLILRAAAATKLDRLKFHPDRQANIFEGPVDVQDTGGCDGYDEIEGTLADLPPLTCFDGGLRSENRLEVIGAGHIAEQYSWRWVLAPLPSPHLHRGIKLGAAK